MIGGTAKATQAGDALARARQRAALMPDLLVEAQRIASAVTTGWHGRKRRGIGDAFWQFRPYDSGESLARIDWRRTARDDAITVRDQEWEAAHTVWVFADGSASMLYKSEQGEVSKESRALVLALSLAEILARSGERVGWPGVTGALSSRNAAERIATALSQPNAPVETGFPDLSSVSRHSETVIISDFLDPVEEVMERIRVIAQRGIRGALVQIIDPAEEAFPFSGRTEFRDPETGARETIGRVERLRGDYVDLFEARKKALADRCRGLGWHHIVHHTDRPASTALVALHTRLSGQFGAIT